MNKGKGDFRDATHLKIWIYWAEFKIKISEGRGSAIDTLSHLKVYLVKEMKQFSCLVNFISDYFQFILLFIYIYCYFYVITLIESFLIRQRKYGVNITLN